MSKKDWSENGLVFYHEGKAWALTKNLTTVCIGDKEEIELILAGEKRIPRGMHPVRKDIIREIRDQREKMKKKEPEVLKVAIRGKRKTNGKRK